MKGEEDDERMAGIKRAYDSAAPTTDGDMQANYGQTSGGGGDHCIV